MKLVFMQIFSSSLTFTLLGPCILLSTVLKHPESIFILQQQIKFNTHIHQVTSYFCIF